MAGILAQSHLSPTTTRKLINVNKNTDGNNITGIYG
jgi:hypothetical protein